MCFLILQAANLTYGSPPLRSPVGVQLQIIDMTGRVLSQQSYSKPMTELRAEVNVDALSPGLYRVTAHLRARGSQSPLREAISPGCSRSSRALRSGIASGAGCAATALVTLATRSSCRVG